MGLLAGQLAAQSIPEGCFVDAEGGLHSTNSAGYAWVRVPMQNVVLGQRLVYIFSAELETQNGSILIALGNPETPSLTLGYSGAENGVAVVEAGAFAEDVEGFSLDTAPTLLHVKLYPRARGGMSMELATTGENPVNKMCHLPLSATDAVNGLQDVSVSLQGVARVKILSARASVLGGLFMVR